MVGFIPEELIYEILVRIPATDLLKFKSVCKRWRFLFSQTKFAYDNLRYSKSEDQIIFSSIRLNCYLLYEVDSYSINMQENAITQEGIKLPFKDVSCIKYSCNGMILFQNLNEFEYTMLTIYNPVTRVRNHLPPAPPYCSTWILVHDSSIRKYKVFGIRSPTKIFVFTQGETNWKYLQTPALPTFERYEFITIGEPICFGNKLHWTAVFHKESTQDWSTSIYSIDVADEEPITRIEIPFSVKPDHILSEVSGSLYITNNFGDRLETWVLKDMAKNLWTKCCSVGYGSLLPGNPYSKHLVAPRDIEDSSTFLDQSKYVIIDFRGNISVYDIKGKGLRNFPLMKCKEIGLLENFCFHINSLVNWE